MTNTLPDTDQLEDTSMYFWLGDNAEAEELAEADFEARIAAFRKAREDFLNVR